MSVSFIRKLLRRTVSGPLRAEVARRPGRPRRWAWFLAGMLLVVVFHLWRTSVRRLSEPIEVDFGPTSPAFVGSLGPLLSAQFTNDNTVRMLSNGKEFVPAMLEDIRSARKTITLETYIWASGEMSDRFIEALVERARAGVKVHALADGVGMINLDESDQHRMLDAGIEFVAYGREHWWEIKPSVNNRTHRKLLMVDGRVGYTGGMCIDDAWLGDADSPEVWRDLQVRAEGTVVNQMQAVFAVNWLQTTGRLLVGADYFPTHGAGPGAMAQCYKSGPHEDPENARMSYLLAIAAARRSIKLAHAYFVPDDLAIEMLIAARRRGVAVQVIVPAKNDSRFGRAASRSRWGKLLEAGVEFHLFEPAMYHAKLMIVDDVLVTIGSVNFDERSFRLSDEVSVNVLDEEFARASVRLFDSDMKSSEPLTLEDFRGRPFWLKATDHFCGLFRSQL